MASPRSSDARSPAKAKPAMLPHDSSKGAKSGRVSLR